MKFPEVLEELTGLGYDNRVHPRPTAIVDGVAIDRQVVADHGKCSACGSRRLRYEPFMTPECARGSGYRAFAVCEECDEAMEF